MKIYGVRFYPQSVKIDRGGSSPIYIHDSVSEDCSDFYYIFRLMAPMWRDHFIANDFSVNYDEQMRLEDPLPGLREEFGSGLLAVDVGRQLLLLKGSDFEQWGQRMYFCEGAFLPIFREPPGFDFLKEMYWGREFRLSPESWPRSMRGLLHMWDDVYWQYFTTEKSDVDSLVSKHKDDPRLKMYFVDFEKEFPDPSNEKLAPAVLAESQ